MGVRIPKYRRHPNGQAFIEYKKDITYLGIYDSPKSRARYAKIVAQIAAGLPPSETSEVAKDPTIDELSTSYLNYAAQFYSQDGKPTKEYAGVDAAMRHLFQFCTERYNGILDGADFGPAKLMEFQQYLVDARYAEWRRKPKDGETPPELKRYARPYINKTVSRVKRFFRWCCQRELLPADLYHRLVCVQAVAFGRTSAPEPDDILPVPRVTVEATLPYLNPTVAAMVQVQMLCGMRPAEVCIMRGRDIDRSGPIWLYIVSEHKSSWRKHVLTKAIPTIAQKIMRPFWRASLDDFIFSPRDSIAQKNGKFTPRKGRPIRERYDTCSYRRAIVYGLEKARRAGVEIDHWHPNQLRHSIATEIRQLVGEQAAQLWLGHAHMQTTGIYAQKQVSELLDVARELDRRWAT
jgi:integrase